MLGFGLIDGIIEGEHKVAKATVVVILSCLFALFSMWPGPADAYTNTTHVWDFDSIAPNGTFDGGYPYTQGDDNDTSTYATCNSGSLCGLWANYTTTGKNITGFTVTEYLQKSGSGGICGLAYYSYNNDSWSYMYTLASCTTGTVTLDLPADAFNESPVQVQWFGYASGANAARLGELNFTYEDDFNALTTIAYDENTQTQIDFNLTISNGSSSEDYENITVFKTSDIPTGDVTLFYSSDGYTDRQRTATISVSGNTNITAYLLPTGDGIYHSTSVLRQGDDTPIEGASVNIQKNFNGVYRSIEQHDTDATGTAINYLDPTTLYHFVISTDGYTSETFDIYPNPVSPIIYVRLTYTGAEGADYVNFSTIFTNISYQFLPETFYQNETFNASFEIVDTDSSLVHFSFNSSYPNGTLICSEYVDDQPAGSLVECNVPGLQGYYYVQATFETSEYGNYSFPRLTYWVVNETASTIPQLGTAVSGFSYFLISMVIATILSAFLARFSLYGAGIAFVIVIAIAVGLNPSLMVGEVSGWLILGAMILGVIAITFLRSRV